MRIIVTGAGGQLGRALQQTLVAHDVLALTHGAVDVTDRPAVLELAGWEPDVIIHAAAMTNVDGCEHEPETAYRVNALGTQNVALLAQRSGAVLCYVSTDYVYDGEKGEPYWEWDETNPLSVYGASKRAGEWYVRNLLSRFYIARTAWVYGPGGINFPRKVLDLADKHPALRMVDTEAGHPTYAPHLAEGLANLITSDAYGIYHVVNEGCTTRYDLARAVLDGAGMDDYPMEAIEHYPRAAQVPARAELHTLAARSIGVQLPHWREGVTEWLKRRT